MAVGAVWFMAEIGAGPLSAGIAEGMPIIEGRVNCLDIGDGFISRCSHSFGKTRQTKTLDKALL